MIEPTPTKPTPLIPGVRLEPCRPDHAERFRRSFLRTWSRIPDADRVVIRGAWAGLWSGPEIRIANTWSNRAPGTLAEVRRDGLRLMFLDAAVETLPEPLLDALLAHELAHAVQFATGTRFADVDEEEDDADDRVTAWGFPMRSLRQWAARYTEELIDEAATTTTRA